MRRLLLILLALAWQPGLAQHADAVGIAAVLDRSQQQRLDSMPLADLADPNARRVRASFERLLAHLAPSVSIELRVVRGETPVAQTLHGRIVVAGETLGALPEGQRVFVLAHEIGHVVLGHWAQFGRVYQKWVPGAVTREHTDAFAHGLGREASSLSHRHEFEADAYGLRAVRALRLSDSDVMEAFKTLGVRSDTASHPSTRKRLSALRATAPDSRQAEAR